MVLSVQDHRLLWDADPFMWKTIWAHNSVPHCSSLSHAKVNFYWQNFSHNRLSSFVSACSGERLNLFLVCLLSFDDARFDTFDIRLEQADSLTTKRLLPKQLDRGCSKLFLLTLWFAGGHGTFFGFVNSFSHSIMYSYLFLIGVFPKLKQNIPWFRPFRIALSVNNVHAIIDEWW